MLDHVAAVAAESDRFARAVAAAATIGDPSTMSVPTCPDWSLDDLVWHLTEVQEFWTAIVAGRLDDPSTVELAPRPEPAGLAARFDEARAGLVGVLGDTDPDVGCWSWYDEGHSVGWVRRRQANEALIHGVDAELTVAAADPAGASTVGPIDGALAADGIDEMLVVMLGVGAVPGWARWTADGPTVRLEAEVGPGAERDWTVRLGRLQGTDPAGVDRDLGAIEVIDGADPAGADAVVRGTAAELDLWLWRRGPLAESAIDGDATAVDRLLELAALE